MWAERPYTPNFTYLPALSTTQCITARCPVRLLRCALLPLFPAPSSPIVPYDLPQPMHLLLGTAVRTTATNIHHLVCPTGTAVSTNLHTPQYDLLGLQYNLLQPTSATLCALPGLLYSPLPPTHIPSSMLYWDCSMTYCYHLHTTQRDLLGLQYDLLQPTYAPPSMTYWDCSMTYCDQPTHPPV